MSKREAKKPVLAVLGPTASGKSSLAAGLAKALNGEIVNCDSRQIYQEMFIGTATPMPQEQKEVKHHLYSFLPPDQSFSAADYSARAVEVIRKIWISDKIPILTGGTGFYYSAISEGLGSAGQDPELSENLRLELEENGLDFMIDKLRCLDPDAPDQVDVQNPRRVLRAIEIVTSTQSPLCRNVQVPPLPEAEFMPIVVSRPRNILHKIIKERIDRMISLGLEQEVKFLSDKYGFDVPGMKSIGYQEWQNYFCGKASLVETCELILIHTRQYAKRQLTWFRKKPGEKLFDLENNQHRKEIFSTLTDFLDRISL